MIKTLKAFIIVFVSALIFISCSKKPTEVVQEYETAFNSHSVSKLLSLFSDNAFIELSVLNKLKGKDQIKDYFEYDSVLSSNITISDVSESNGSAYFVMSLRNDILKSIGINEAKYSMIFKISDGKIENITASTTNETDNKLKEFQKPFMLWAGREKLDILNEIMPNGNLDFNAENAKKYLSLIFEWKKNNKTSLIKSPVEKEVSSKM